ncbi:hypothetical protein M9H77_17325 [Catharanthus roseus]|uniref:Uncharacterized protein n=1 Tax=Catharanthus roseus TaxID=4058 RepID=A0ACC0B4A1_CATRO|nr:hypothetical protein M9H77_17325 [Catharanthus roseus]
MRCPKNGLPILLQSKHAKIVRPIFASKRQNRTTNSQNQTTNTKNQTISFCVKQGNRDIQTPKMDEEETGFIWISLTHKNNLISHSRFSLSQVTQARSQPRMATNGGSNRRIHREQTVTEE